MQRIILGDNQFFGVNHMSEEKARAQMLKFQDVKTIIDVLDIAINEGIKAFMCTTHERVVEICDHVRANSRRYQDFEFYPCMPYAHKYANAVTELGIYGALKFFLPDQKLLGSLVRGGVSIARKDVVGLTRMLIDSEMKMFRDLKTPVIFMQNVVTDLILGLDCKEGFRMFADHVRNCYDAEPGFITMNMPTLLDSLDACGINNPIVCSNINKVGFRMCGGIGRYETALATRQFRPIAMSILASGAIPPREAVEYVCKQPNIKSIVFGASSHRHIAETKRLIEEFL